MRIVENRGNVILRTAAERGLVVRARESLEYAPAIVAAIDDRHIDFLARALADVAGPLDARDGVEAEAPRIAEAVRKDLVGARGRAKEGIGRRRRIRAGCADVDPQDLPEQHIDVLRVVRRIVGRAAVAHADVEIIVPTTKRQHSAVVVRIRRMRDG